MDKRIIIGSVLDVAIKNGLIVLHMILYKGMIWELF
jgi:hypothetical protein